MSGRAWSSRTGLILGLTACFVAAIGGVFVGHSLHLYRGSRGDFAVLIMALAGAFCAEVIHRAVAARRRS